MCTDLPTPDNGRVIYSTDTTSSYDFGTTVTYVCNTGFGINGGDVLRTCQGNGQSPTGAWTGTAPWCQGAVNTMLR